MEVPLCMEIHLMTLIKCIKDDLKLKYLLSEIYNNYLTRVFHAGNKTVGMIHRLIFKPCNEDIYKLCNTFQRNKHIFFRNVNLL